MTDRLVKVGGILPPALLIPVQAFSYLRAPPTPPRPLPSPSVSLLNSSDDDSPFGSPGGLDMAPIQRLDISPLALAPHWLLSEWWVRRGVC